MTPFHVHGSSPAALVAILALARRGHPVRWTAEEPARWNDCVKMRDGLLVPTDPEDELGVEVLRLVATIGIPFDRSQRGVYLLHRGPEDVTGRFLRAGTSTGQRLQFALAREVERRSRIIDCHPGTRLLDFRRSSEGHCVGVTVLEVRDVRVVTHDATCTLLADHGLTSLAGSRGTHPRDVGHALAACVRRGLEIRRARSFDEHPWTLSTPSGRRSLPLEIGRAHGFVYGYPPHHDQVLDPERVSEPWRDLTARFARRGSDGSRQELQPAIHRSRGGLWVDAHGMTVVPGLFAARPCSVEDENVDSVDPHALLSALRSGMRAARGMLTWWKKVGGAKEPAADGGTADRRIARLLEARRPLGKDVVHAAREAIWSISSSSSAHPLEFLREAEEQLESTALSDPSPWMNRDLLGRLDLLDELVLARAMAEPAADSSLARS